MTYWSIAVLLLSVSVFAYRYPPTTLMSLPSWLWAGERHKDGGGDDGQSAKSAASPVGDKSHNEAQVTVEVTEHSEVEKTPKARYTEPESAITIISLDETPLEEPPKSPPSGPAMPSVLALNSTQRSPSGPRPSKPSLTPSHKGSAALMPPPPRPMQAPRLSAVASLRVPSTGPLPNRGPPANSQQRVNGSLSPNGAINVPKARGKVMLAPGHSPIDWAALTRSKNLSGVDAFQRVTPSKLKSMTGRKGKPAWTSWQGKVYNITPYLPFHPGGEAELMKAAGRDGTNLFMEVHPWVNWENMLSTCLVGALVPENDGMGTGQALEDMD